MRFGQRDGGGVLSRGVEPLWPKPRGSEPRTYTRFRHDSVVEKKGVEPSLGCLQSRCIAGLPLPHGTAMASRTPSKPLIRRSPTTSEIRRVENRGVEPLTFCLPDRRSAMTELVPLDGGGQGDLNPSVSGL